MLFLPNNAWVDRKNTLEPSLDAPTYTPSRRPSAAVAGVLHSLHATADGSDTGTVSTPPTRANSSVTAGAATPPGQCESSCPTAVKKTCSPSSDSALYSSSCPVAPRYVAQLLITRPGGNVSPFTTIPPSLTPTRAGCVNVRPEYSYSENPLPPASVVSPGHRGPNPLMPVIT